jgi:hypothetical protein
MISSLQQYKSSLVWFMTGLVLVFLLSWISTPSTPVYQSNVTAEYAEYTASDFSASHLEPNFYQ